MGKYDSSAATALALIKRKGTAVTVTRPGQTEGTFDPVTQGTTGAVDGTHTFHAVALPPGRAAEYRVGSLIGKTALEFYFAQKDQTITPRNGDIVTLNGIAWKIFWSQTYDPAGDGAILTIAYGER